MAERRDKIILGLDAGPYVRGLAKASTATKAFVKELDASDSRMSNLVQASLALGPALVPISAAAVPAVAALTTGLGAAAGAAGVAALAFNGVGDGLKALNEYQLEPSAANLEKVRQAFEDLGPAGTDFVLFLDDLEPKLDKLQNTARAGLLPGVEEGIRSLMDRAPQVNRIIGEISGALGDLAAEGGDALASGKFDNFFNYIETEARPILMDMGRTVGNVAEGLANILVGFGPTSSDFSDALLGLSRDFARWSRRLEKNEGFQEFVDYVERVGPKVADTFGAIVIAVGDIVEAAAPVGEVSLPVIKALANTLGAIADSPAGPVLVGAAAGISALSRAVALYNVTNGAAIAGLLGKFAKAKIGAAGVGALALSFTDLDDKMGISNTTMGATIGILGGPWGVAIGAAAGSVLDMAAANDQLDAAIERVNDTAGNPTGIKQHAAALADLRDQVANARNFGADEFAEGDVLGFIDSFSDAVGNKLTGSTERAADELARAEFKFKGFKQAIDRFGADANPALRKVGLSLEELAVNRLNPFLWGKAADAVAEYRKESASLPGRTHKVRKAIAGLEDPLRSTTKSADKLEAAMEALIGPELDARRAALDWKDGLAELRKALRRTNGNINDNTQAGRDNLNLIYDQIELAAQRLSIARREGKSAEFIRRLYRRQRDTLLDLADAQGVSRKRLNRMMSDLGFAPGLFRKSRKEARDFGDTLLGLPGKVAPIIKADGAKEAEKATENFMRSLVGLPPREEVKVDAPGAKKSKDDVDAFDKAVEQLNPFAETKVDAPGAKKAKDETDDFWHSLLKLPNDKKVQTAAPGAREAKSDFERLNDSIRDLDGKNVDVTLSTHASKIIRDIKDAVNPFQADGSVMDFYANGDIRNGHVAQIAPAGAWRVWAEEETGGEAYIPLAQSKRPRSRAIADETVRRLGGSTEWHADGAVRIPTGGNDPQKPLARIDDMHSGIAKEMGREASKYLSKQLLSMGGGFHWPLPRQYGPSGTWGHYRSGGSHPALDWPAPLGTPIYSVLPGKVMYTRHMNTSYGNHTEVAHGRGLSSLYAHQYKILVKPGQRVASGEKIGLVDSTGNSSGNHLHLELQRNGNSFNYTPWLHGGGPAWIDGGQFDGNIGKGAGGAKEYAKAAMSRYGWGRRQWPPLEALWQSESGWNYQADNPTSSAYGIPQALVETHGLRPPYYGVQTGPSDYRGGDPQTQIDWGLRYISGRYGTPSAAWSFKQGHNWYGDGGINAFDRGGMFMPGMFGANFTGRPERVLDPRQTEFFEQMVKDLDVIARNSSRTRGGRLGGWHGGTDRSGPGRKHWRSGINFPALFNASDREQRILEKAGRRFDIREGHDRAKVDSEIDTLIGAIKEAVGKDSHLFEAFDRVRDRLNETAKSLDKERRQRERMVEDLKELRRKSREFSTSVASNFRNDAFSGGLDEFLLQVRADRNDAKSFKRALSRAENRGLSGALFNQLAESGNVELAQQFGRSSRAKIRKFERLFEQRQRRSREAGDRAARERFGERLRDQTRATNRQTRAVEKLENKLVRIEDRIGDRVEHGARKGTREGQGHRRKRLHQMTLEARG